jgi:hypothetical protein
MPTSQQYPAIDSYDLVATIPASATASQQVDLAGNSLCGFFFPASFTGASIKLSVATAGGGSGSLLQKDEIGGGDYAVTVSAGTFVPVSNLALVAGVRFVSIVSSAAEGAQRNITLAVRPV